MKAEKWKSVLVISLVGLVLVACNPAASKSDPTPSCNLVRGPYLQSVTPDSVIVVWETDQPSEGVVAYGKKEVCDASVTDQVLSMRHAVTLTNLAPYTMYRYRVESCGAPLSEDLTFRTAAGPDQSKFKFVAFGDTRTGHSAHQAVVDRIIEQSPDFVVHTGDLVAEGGVAQDWNVFFEVERGLMARAPFFPVLGNHERDHPNYFDFFYLPGNEQWYTFTYGNARFVCLQVDGADADGADSFFPGSEQYEWLEETLAANTQPWLFVVFHIAPYTSVDEGWESWVRQILTPLFDWYGVDVVFNGHRHNYERNEVNGINDVTYVVTGGGGAPLYEMEEQEPTQAAFAAAHHFVLVEIEDEHLKATAISRGGEKLDVFERRAD